MSDFIRRQALIDWVNKQREEVTKKQAAGTDGGIFTREALVTMQRCLSAFEIAINQQKNDNWIPCSEQLPEEERFYIVTYKFDDEENYKCHELYYGVEDGESKAGWYIDDDCEKLYKPFTVIAWQPLPEEYKEGI